MEETAPHDDKTGTSELKGVVFVREDRQQGITGTKIYRIHKGSDAASTKAFLQENLVHKPLNYIVIETPEGNYGRDIDGIYKE